MESIWAGDVNACYFLSPCQQEVFRTFSKKAAKKAAIKQETVVKYKIDISQVLFLLGRDSYSEHMEKRSKANFNHSNKNELASSFMQYVATSYDKRMILFFDSFNSFKYRDLGRQHTKKNS